jgi:hypothetical protein
VNTAFRDGDSLLSLSTDRETTSEPASVIQSRQTEYANRGDIASRHQSVIGSALERMTTGHKPPEFRNRSTSNPEAASRYAHLVEQHVKNTKRAVLGHYPAYLHKARQDGASYFHITHGFKNLQKGQQWALNKRFLDKIADNRARAFLSVKLENVGKNSWLAGEVNYLLTERRYSYNRQDNSLDPP